MQGNAYSTVSVHIRIERFRHSSVICRAMPSLYVFHRISRYEWVFALKRDFPDMQFSLNGGVQSLSEVHNILNHQLDDGASVCLTLFRADFKRVRCFS